MRNICIRPPAADNDDDAADEKTFELPLPLLVVVFEIVFESDDNVVGRKLTRKTFSHEKREKDRERKT